MEILWPFHPGIWGHVTKNRSAKIRQLKTHKTVILSLLVVEHIKDKNFLLLFFFLKKNFFGNTEDYVNMNIMTIT